METDPNAFKRRYEKLNQNRKKFILFNRLGAVAGLFLLGSILVSASGKISTGLPFLIELLFFIGVPMAVMYLFLTISNRYLLPKNRRLFFKFYNTEIELESFSDFNSPQNKKKAKTSIDRLASYVSGWISLGAPNSFNELPRSISTNLREKMLPMIEKEDKQVISSYRTTLFNFILRIEDREPSIDDLTYFSNGLKSLKDGTKAITEPKSTYGILGTINNAKEFFSRHPKLRFVPIGVLAYVVIWIYIQNTQSPEIIKSFVDNSTIAGVILTVMGIFFGIWTLKSDSNPFKEAKKNND